ncbi:hypothetical protein F4824DRAFT_512023 [Ustulina deusta]|nr:hypothetical protein F4824DRAFT_512023 [Ustulina deusta]
MFPIYIFTSLLVLTSVAATPNTNETETAVNTTAWTGQGRIPVYAIGCWQDRIDDGEIAEASRKLKDWGENKLIRAGDWHGEEHSLAGVWVCNCKHFYNDHVVAWELDEALERLHDSCGKNQAGWVWSRKWQKRFNYGSARFMKKKGLFTGKCPLFCLWSLR